MPKLTLISLDTNVLIDLADGNETIIDCLQTMRSRIAAPKFIVLPTVLQELADIAENADGKKKQLAYNALTRSFGEFGIQPVNCLPVGHGIVEQTGKKLIDRNLLPAGELHDSFVVSEAALANASILLSSDEHILGIDQNSLKLELDQCDLSAPLIKSPFEIIEKFFLKKD